MDDPSSRATQPGHVTCSAAVIDHDRRVLHIVHKATGKLLAPGGHVEDDRTPPGSGPAGSVRGSRPPSREPVPDQAVPRCAALVECRYSTVAVFADRVSSSVVAQCLRLSGILQAEESDRRPRRAVKGGPRGRGTACCSDLLRMSGLIPIFVPWPLEARTRWRELCRRRQRVVGWCSCQVESGSSVSRSAGASWSRCGW